MTSRLLLLYLLCGGALGAQQRDVAASRFQFLTTVRQYGPVGYRDPLGAVSPDGKWLATASETGIRVQAVVGGPVTELGARDAQVTELAWVSDSRHLAVRTRDFRLRTAQWRVYDVISGARAPLWPERQQIRGTQEGDTASVGIAPGDLVELAWSPSGDSVAGMARGGGRSTLWVVRADGGGARLRERTWRLSFPAWRPDGRGIACLAQPGTRQQLDLACGSAAAAGADDADQVEAYGPIAFAPDGRSIYYPAPNARGTLDLRRRQLDGPDERLTTFARDAYAPSVTRDGRVVFKVQDYRVFIADAPSAGGASRQLTAFQSETPTWSTDGRFIGVTFGSWRRVIDDFHYPDIAQDLGLVVVQDTPVVVPATVFRATPSEDQGMAWSPNGRWIAFHSHADGTDDVYLQPADRSRPAWLVTQRLYETGWPRWSPDGRWIVVPSEDSTLRASRSFLSIVGIDPTTGAITTRRQRVAMAGFPHGALHAEWLAGGEAILFDAITALGHKGLYVVPRAGGQPRLIHPYRSDQVYSGIAVSPDFRWVAFVAPASDGRYQIFRVPVAEERRNRSHSTRPTRPSLPIHPTVAGSPSASGRTRSSSGCSLPNSFPLLPLRSRHCPVNL